MLQSLRNTEYKKEYNTNRKDIYLSPAETFMTQICICKLNPCDMIKYECWKELQKLLIKVEGRKTITWKKHKVEGRKTIT